MSYSADFIRVTYHAVECSLKVICEQLSSLLAENVGKGRQRGGGESKLSSNSSYTINF